MYATERWQQQSRTGASLAVVQNRKSIVIFNLQYRTSNNDKWHTYVTAVTSCSCYIKPRTNTTSYGPLPKINNQSCSQKLFPLCYICFYQVYMKHILLCCVSYNLAFSYMWKLAFWQVHQPNEHDDDDDDDDTPFLIEVDFQATHQRVLPTPHSTNHYVPQ